ncbi:MAG TPA: acetyltransferase [Oscillatoriaceae cyanobacterium]
MRIAIYGAGGHGKVVWDILRVSGHSVVGFVDTGEVPPELLGLPVVKQPSDLPEFDGMVIAVGQNRTRQRLFERMQSEGYLLVNAIHPSAVLSERLTLGVGVVIAAGVIVNVDGEIGDNVILNTGSRVDHDCRIGAHVHVAPGTVLGGNVAVGEGAFLGIGTRAIPGMRIGAWATCGAGSVVIREVAPDSTVVGVPARPIRRATPT